LTKVRRLALVVSLVALLLPAAADARSFGSRTLHRGSTGSDVRTLQSLLTQAGYSTTADGVFGRATARSVKAWESGAHRKVDGRVTRRDARALRADAGTGHDLGEDPVADQPVEGDQAAKERNPRQTGGASYVRVTNGYVTDDGLAVAPDDAPQEVKDIIDAGNRIYDKPYKYGGGHGKWRDSGYDCSGSVSFALHGAGLLKRSLDSTGFESWGAEGPGNWVTVYANSGHAYMVVAGLRFDTSGASSRGGTRWTEEMRSSDGYVARHPAGL
jgi:peptidoglycan hydrolase-like protein with peptidoglycan-binding domain